MSNISMYVHKYSTTITSMESGWDKIYTLYSILLLLLFFKSNSIKEIIDTLITKTTKFDQNQ